MSKPLDGDQAVIDQARTAPTLEGLRSRRDEIIALAKKYGAYNIRVFGSVARGDATPESDIDLLVDFEDWASLYELSGLWQDLRDLLGRQVDVLSDHMEMRARLRKRVLRDAVPL